MAKQTQSEIEKLDAQIAAKKAAVNKGKDELQALRDKKAELLRASEAKAKKAAV